MSNTLTENLFPELLPGSINGNGHPTATLINNGDDMRPAVEIFRAASDELYKHIGFQLATESSECPEEKFKQYLKDHEARVNQVKDEIRKVSEFNIQRYKDKIDAAKQVFDPAYATLRMEVPGIADLQQKKLEHETVLSQKKQALFASLKEYLEKRPNLLKSKQEELKTDLINASKNAGNLYEQKRDTLKQFYADFGTVYDEKLNWLRELKAKLVGRYEAVQEELKRNDLRGMGPTLFNFLIALGTTGAVVAGWFFAVFINAQNTTGFEHLAIGQVISNLMDFSSQQQWYITFGTLALFLIVVFQLSKTMHRQARKLSDEAKNNVDGKKVKVEDQSLDESWEWSRAGIDPISGTFKAKNWYSFILKSLPWIFVVGFMLILMAYSKHGKDFAGSITGETIGFLCCIALSGAAYIYIANKKHNQRTDVRSTRLEIAVLFAVLVGFNLAVGCLLLFSKNFIQGIGIIQFKQFFALINFILIATITAMIIGYGNYYKGLVTLSSFLNWKINKVDDQIRRKSGVENIYNTIIRLSKDTSELNAKMVNQAADNLENFNNQLLENGRMVMSNNLQNNGNAYPCLSDADARMFPEHDLIIRNLILECQEEAAKLESIQNEIRKIRTQQEENLQNSESLLDLHNNRLHQWNNEIIDEKRSLLDRLAAEEHRFLWQQVQLKDGYHLGMIYRTQEGSVMPSYYKPCIGNNILG